MPSSAVPAVEGRAATTIRLRPAAAAALNSAWLHQRMHVNPKLSYPEFASEIVRLGLAAFEPQTPEAVRPKGVRQAGAPGAPTSGRGPGPAEVLALGTQGAADLAGPDHTTIDPCPRT
jgi:hypothetical protein